MLSSEVIDLAIGLIFVFAVTAAFSSVITELIARFLGLRGAYLLSGIRELVDGSGSASAELGAATTSYHAMQDMIMHGTRPPELPSVAGALLGGPILRSQGMAGQISGRTMLMLAPGGGKNRPAQVTTAKAGGNPVRRRASLWRERRSLPSYIAGRSFADAVVDLVVPGAGGQTTMTTIQHNVDALPDDDKFPFKPSLQALVKTAGRDTGRFRDVVERWYDDHMDRVSGWYKRYVAKITLVVGAILVLLLNVNTLTIGRTLYSESTVAAAVSTVAAKATSCSGTQTRSACLADLQAQLSAAASAGLPIGWGTVRDCIAPTARCNWLDQRGIFSRHGDSGWQLVLVLVGFLITTIALIPGARFWFGILSKLGSMRATGPKPTPAGT